MARMPNYDVRNDGIGPYAVFYCEKCSREYRSKPNVVNTMAKDIGRQALGGALRGIPLFGGAISNSVAGEDPKYITHLTPEQVEAAWGEVKTNFRECPTCMMVCCLSDWDMQANTCKEDSPRRAEIAEAEGEQAAGVMKGIANVFGIGDAIKSASVAAQQAAASTAKCSKCGVMAAPGTKFCPECGGAMIQPTAAKCSKCGANTMGAKFCPECGAPVATAPTKCGKCGAELKGAKFCPECGTKAG